MLSTRFGIILFCLLSLSLSAMDNFEVQFSGPNINIDDRIQTTQNSVIFLGRIYHYDGVSPCIVQNNILKIGNKIAEEKQKTLFHQLWSYVLPISFTSKIEESGLYRSVSPFFAKLSFVRTYIPSNPFGSFAHIFRWPFASSTPIDTSSGENNASIPNNQFYQPTTYAPQSSVVYSTQPYYPQPSAPNIQNEQGKPPIDVSAYAAALQNPYPNASAPSDDPVYPSNILYEFHVPAHPDNNPFVDPKKSDTPAKGGGLMGVIA